MPFGLYLHYPFCRSRCSYCDFCNELHDTDLEKRFYDALLIETELAASECKARGRQLSSIFVGGGTPSITNLDLFEQWVDSVRRLFRVPPDIEFTAEFNPESATLHNLTVCRQLGLNRPVFGVQTFSRRMLRVLDRRHRPHHSQRAVYYANALGYRNFGIDMIFGLPGQTSRMLSDDLDQVLDLEPPHISFFRLTFEADTELGRMTASGDVTPPGSDLVMAMYRGGCERMTEAGYRRYEVSSFSKPGYECQHNLGYWQGGDYLGLGPSAHSCMDGKRFVNVSDVSTYIAQSTAGHLPREVDGADTYQWIGEAIALGLRTSRGISRSQFSMRFGVPVESRLNPEQYRLLVESGHLLPESDSLRLSDKGILVADEITRRLID